MDTREQNEAGVVPEGIAARLAPWLALLAVAALSAVIFRQVLPPGQCLFTTDDSIGAVAPFKADIPQGFLGSWNDSSLVGSPIGLLPISWSSLCLWVLPLRSYINWIHGGDLALASLLFMAFLRRCGVGWAACGLGLLAAFWVGSNVTLTYAGHTPKFSTLLFAMMALYGIERASKPSAAWSVATGLALGVMLTEQQDLALFFGLFWAAYAAFCFVRRVGPRRYPVIAGHLALMGVVALLFCAPALWRTWSTDVAGGAPAEKENAQASWEFATQWSWPPEETVDFIAPGYMGWRSGEPEGPYWGRMGRSAGWEQTQQGFMNFKLENQYLGAIPVVFAALAVVAACRRRPADVDVASDEGRTRRQEIVFWAAVTVVSLLLAFGKYFPLYSLFYQLPVIHSIRNPNKFLQVFQVAMGILAAYGLDGVLRARRVPA